MSLITDDIDSLFRSARTSGVPAPVDAVTVIIVHPDRPPNPFKVFLMRRNREQRFMGGAFVFPGGRLEREDCDSVLAERAKGFNPDKAKEKLNEPALMPEKAMGLFFAAIRETFEEAGVLLAASPDGHLLNLSDAETKARFRNHRVRLHAGETSLREIAEAEGLSFRLDLLTPFSRWITPEVEIQRFDTRFFLARMPQDQNALHDSVETVESLWLTPEKALLKNRSHQVVLMPPTLKTIEELSRFSCIEQLLNEAEKREIHPVLPQPFADGRIYGVRLPNDPEYSIVGYKRPFLPGDSSRIIFHEGAWHLTCFAPRTTW